MRDSRPGDKTVDAACGIGWFAATVASQYGARLLAIEASGCAVSGARKRYGNATNLDSQACDGLLIVYKESFDKTVRLDVLERFPYEDAHFLLKKIDTALREESKLILCVPVNDV